MTTIVAFGDSITHGAAFPPEERWTALAEARLNRAGKLCRVINSGIGGHTTGQGLERIEKDVLAHSPALVLIEFGYNDCHIPNGVTPRTPIEDFRRNQRRIGELIRETGAEIVYIANHPTLNFSMKADGRTYEASSQLYNAVTREIAAELDAPLLDLHVRFGRLGMPLAQLLTEDGLHLSPAGNREYVVHVEVFLSPRL